MGQDILAGGVGEIRALSTANGGTALTTTATYIGIPEQVSHLYITPRNLVTDPVAKFALNPYLVVLKTTDAMATAPTDYSSAAQDCDDSTVITFTSLDTLANSGFLLIGAHLHFRGFYVTMSATVNGTASVMSVDYWKSDKTWATTTATDGTTSGGKTFAQSGLVYWTVPSTWVRTKLSDIYSGASLVDGAAGVFTGSPIYLFPGSNTVTCTTAGDCTITLPTGSTGMVRGSASGGGTMAVTSEPVVLAAGANTVTTSGAIGTIAVTINTSTPHSKATDTELYWVRVSVDAAVDSSTATSIYAANRSTAYGELLAGQPFEQRIKTGIGGYGCVEGVMAAGTGNLIVNGASERGGNF
jgi:hypothetical protein